ncbi:MAG: MerR family DNA-binding transcriptional regulator [Microbacteriaceae bacterium]|nr:MerR family DNA-binding transcriptional regulator [Microbacteriaceae bacterium]
MSVPDGSENASPGGPTTQPRAAGPRESLSIGELAKRARVSPRTIRFYEEVGILPTPERTEGGTRRYPENYVFYLEGTKIFKDLGFSLDEIAEVAQFALTRESPSERTRELLHDKIYQLERRVRVLKKLQSLVSEATKGNSSDSELDASLFGWISTSDVSDE